MQFVGQKCSEWPIIWIYGVFWWFLSISKIFLIFTENCPIFGQKNTRFFADAAKIWENDFRRKVYAFFQKWSNWPKLWYKCSLGYPLEPHVAIFWYFEFQPFYGGKFVTKGAFLVKKPKIMTKNAIFSWIRLYKMAKTQNIKKLLHGVLEGTLRNISTINWVNWTIFEKTHRLSVENYFPKFLLSRQKNGCFLPKNRAIFAKN